MTDNPTEMRTFTVVYDTNSFPLDVARIDAAYFRRAADSELIEFKDGSHRVVFAVASSRVVRIDTGGSGAVAAAERRLRLAQQDEADAITRYREAVRQAQDALVAIKRELAS